METLALRVTPAEAARIRADAERAGISISALLRHAALNVPPPRARRSPTIKHQAVAELLGACGRIRNNLDQIGGHINDTAHAVNAGRDLPNRLAAALRDLKDIRDAAMDALGRGPQP